MTPSNNSKIDNSVWTTLQSVANGDLKIWIMAGLGAAMLSGYALLLEPRLIAWSDFGHNISIVFLMAGLAVLSCLAPAIGPRLAQRVRLTPIIALSSTLILPPALAATPMLLAATISIVFQDEISERRRLLQHFLLIVLAQIATSTLMIFWRLEPALATVSITHGVWIGAVGTATFGLLYLAGLFLQLKKQNRGNKFSWPDSSWHVSWSNEAIAFMAASPFGLILAVIFLRHGSVAAAVCTAVAGVMAAIMSKFIIERKMLAIQLELMEKLTEVAALSKSPTEKRLIEEFLFRSRSLVLYDSARVWLYDDNDTLLRCACEYPVRSLHSSLGKVRRIGESLIGRVAERGSSMIVQDIRRDIRHPVSRFSERQKVQLGPIAQMILPFVANGETLGTVEFERRQWGAFGAADRNRIQGLITLVAMALSNIQQHQDVIQLAATDGLTGLYNKRHIMGILQDEMRRAERYQRPVSVLMMDLDNFKNYNDTFGHVQGDSLLAQMSGIISESIRATDRAGRYGGEEFIVIMPETDKDAAVSTAERIRKRIEMTPFPGRPKAPSNLPPSLHDCFPETSDTWVRKTISIGVASFPRDAHEITSIVALADDALYQAKRAGRNQVVSAEFEQPAPLPKISAA